MTMREELIAAAAKAMAPDLWLPFDGKKHGSPPNQAAAKRHTVKNATAALDTFLARLNDPSEQDAPKRWADRCLADFDATFPAADPKKPTDDR